jgi:hypothetical protein
MRIARILTVLLIFLTCFTISAEAQRTKRPVPRPTPTPKPVINADVAAAKQKVSNQLSNINRFVDILGPIAQSIEATDKDAKTRRLSKAAIAANEANKQKVITAIRNLRAGLVSLETEFRTKPILSKYFLQIQGISNLAAQSEDSALAGKFVASKDPLRTIAQKLTDTMAAMQ